MIESWKIPPKLVGNKIWEWQRVWNSYNMAPPVVIKKIIEF